MSYLLVTNIVSEWTKSIPDPNVVAWLAARDDTDLYLSVASFAELRRGIESMPAGRRRDQLNTWLRFDLTDRFAERTIPIDRRIAESWGVLAATIRQAGFTVGPIDVFFAATAVVHGLTLVTRNVRHFNGLDLMLVNPWEPLRR